jgi:hypothetical protein
MATVAPAGVTMRKLRACNSPHRPQYCSISAAVPARSFRRPVLRIGIVVPCTDSKRASALPVRLRDFGAQDRIARIRHWVTALRSTTWVTPATRLYKGVGWAASDDLMAAPRRLGLEAEALIVSAGHGAVRPTDRIPNYSATFLPGNPDSVPTTGSADPTGENRAWWRDINAHKGSPGPLNELAASVDGLILAASAMYIDALGDDLVAAIGRTPTVVYCSGTPRHPTVAARAPNFDRRLREGIDPFVEANDQSLNQRVAEAALRALGQQACEIEAARELLAEQMDRPRPVRHERKAATDEEITQFIASQMERDPFVSKSSLLRRWRDDGRACEQRRFGRLHDGVRRASLKEEEMPHVDL